MDIIQLNINDEQYELRIEKNWTLVYVLREILQLTGTKAGCNTGDCGSCKVLVDGEAVNSCTLLASKAVGKKIRTIEGVANGTELDPVQLAFIETGAVQCGFCTPGMVISTIGLLEKNPNPNEDEIKAALDNNLCRCTGYVKIIEAVKLASQKKRGEA